MEFEKACSEMNYILKNLRPKDKEKIPNDVIEFFNENKSPIYRVKLTTEKELKNQKLQEETKALLQIIYIKYLAEEEEQQEFENMLKIEQKEETKEITIYKESKFKKFIDKIKKILRIK